MQRSRTNLLCKQYAEENARMTYNASLKYLFLLSRFGCINIDYRRAESSICTTNTCDMMPVKAFLFFAVTIIVLNLCLIPDTSEAFPVNGYGMFKCPPSCAIYCQCGHILDSRNCPTCRCRPSNLCTGRRPNAHPRHRQGNGKSQILY